MAQKRKSTPRKAPVKKKSGSHKKNTPKTNRSWKQKLLISGFKFAVATVMLLALFILFVYLGLFGRLPDESELSKIQHHTASEVFSSDGQLMGRYFVEHRLTIDNNAISQNVKDALIATEDSRFFEHSGLDFISLGRVILRTVILGDHSQGGGSTISQQLAKNLYPRKNHGFLSLPVAKTKEIFVAARLEDVYSKDDILTFYLNTVPFGEDIYGIEMAAQRFFRTKSRNLNPAEAATLVGMLAANTAYNPRINPERSKKRRNIVLDRMQDQGFLSRKETIKWKESAIQLKYRKIDHNTGVAPYFREKVRVQAEKILSENYGDEYDLYSDGLRIYTTIDARLQKYAEEAVTIQLKKLQAEFDKHWKGRAPWEKHPNVYLNAVRQSHRYQVMKKSGRKDEEIFKKMEKKVPMRIFTHNGEKKVTMSPVDSVKHYLRQLNTGFLALDPANGHVLAWVGGIDHKSFQYDHVTSQRSVGSTFKPIVYAAALMNGMEPCDFISNEQRTYDDYDDWSPTNSNGNHEGYYTLKGGLANSMNTISAEVIMRTGIDEVIELAEEMGIDGDIPEVPSIALGTAELSLIDMVGAYTTFANYGRPVEPIGLLRIEDRHGNILYQNEANEDGRQVYDEAVAHFIIDMMRGVVQRGTGKSLRTVYGVKSEVAGKTGTTQDNADGWFIGYSPGLVAGAWVGNDQPSIRFRSTALGSGGHTALPIFARFMKKVEADRRFSNYTARSFYPIPEDLNRRLTCSDFSIEDPDKNLFEKFVDTFDRPDSTKLKRQQERNERQQERKKKDHKNILQRMKDIFKKKN